MTPDSPALIAVTSVRAGTIPGITKSGAATCFTIQFTGRAGGHGPLTSMQVVIHPDELPETLRVINTAAQRHFPETIKTVTEDNDPYEQLTPKGQTLCHKRYAKLIAPRDWPPALLSYMNNLAERKQIMDSDDIIHYIARWMVDNEPEHSQHETD